MWPGKRLQWVYFVIMVWHYMCMVGRVVGMSAWWDEYTVHGWDECMVGRVHCMVGMSAWLGWVHGGMSAPCMVDECVLMLYTVHTVHWVVQSVSTPTTSIYLSDLCPQESSSRQFPCLNVLPSAVFAPGWSVAGCTPVPDEKATMFLLWANTWTIWQRAFSCLPFTMVFWELWKLTTLCSKCCVSACILHASYWWHPCIVNVPYSNRFAKFSLVLSEKYFLKYYWLFVSCKAQFCLCSYAHLCL